MSRQVVALRPVQVDFSIREARAAAACIDVACELIKACGDTEFNDVDLQMLVKRLKAGAVVAEAEQMLS